MTTKKLDHPKFKALEKYAEDAASLFEQKHDAVLKKFAGEQLDKKTAIVCTAFLVEAIKEAARYIVSFSDKSPKDRSWDYQPDLEEPDGAMRFSDPPRPWIAEILTEICGGSHEGATSEDSDDTLVHAHCDAFNLEQAVDRIRHLIKKEGDTKADQIIDGEIAHLKKYAAIQEWPEEFTGLRPMNPN